MTPVLKPNTMNITEFLGYCPQKGLVYSEHLGNKKYQIVVVRSFNGSLYTENLTIGGFSGI